MDIKLFFVWLDFETGSHVPMLLLNCLCLLPPQMWGYSVCHHAQMHAGFQK